MRVVDFTKYIVEGLLGEESKKKIATFAGSFRPPTKSDYNLLLKAIDDNPGLDEIHVFVGDAESEGLDQDDAVKIWQMFGEHFPRNFYVHKSEQSPISDVYAYANKFPTYDIDWLFGVREGNSDDFKQIADRTKSVNKYDNLSISPVVYDNKATEREVAAAANMGKDELAKYMPSNLTYKELDDVYNMLQPNELTEITSTHTSEWDDLLRKLTEEGYEFIPDLQPWEVVIKSNELKKPIFSYSRQFTSNKDFENKSLKVFLSEPESDDFERVNLRHANEEDIEYLKQAGSLGEQMKKLDEALNKYPYDIINKVAEEGWEYYETTGQYEKKEAKVNSVARQEKKKYFTLDAEIKAQKENSFVTIFWSDKGDSPSRDVILGGTMQDYEDIVNAAKSNLNEALIKYSDDIINKIAEEGWEYYETTAQTGSAAKAKVIYSKARKDKKRYFTLNQNDSLLNILWADGKKDTGIFSRDALEGGTEQDMQDIIDTGLSNLNEVATEDLEKFDQVIGKIVDGDFKQYNRGQRFTAHRQDLINDMIAAAKEAGVPGYFSLSSFPQGRTQIHFSTGETFLLDDLRPEDIKDIETAADINLNEVAEDLTEARNVPRFGKMLNKIAEGDYYHVPAEDLQDIGRLEMRQVRYDYKYDIDKPMFSYSIQKTPNELKDIIARFSDDPEDTFWIIDSTEQDRQDLKDVVEQFTTLIPSKLFKEGAEFNLNESKQVGTEFDIYEQIIDFMSQNGMKLDPRPTINIIDNDRENAEQFFGKTAYYDPSNNIVVLYTLGRHPKDVARSFAHELVHCHQNHEGRLEGITTTNTNEDDHLEEIEREAYETGNIMFRKWSDSVKGGALQETVKDNKIICDNCGWEWNIEDGGDDMFTCHKCGSEDNQPIVKEKKQIGKDEFSQCTKELD